MRRHEPRNLDVMDEEFRRRPRGRSGMTQKLDGALERFDEVRLLPGEAALVVRRAAEMAVGRGARVDRAVEVEMAADAARGEVHRLGGGLLEFVLRHLT